MTRSKRKTPRIGITGAASEKEFKTKEHRKERIAVKKALAADGNMPARQEYGNGWLGPKDGKVGFDPDEDPKAMRK